MALSLLGAIPARADERQATLDALNQAIQRTEVAAQSGIDVKQFITYRAPFGLTWAPPGVNTVLRSGSRLRIHVTANPDGSGPGAGPQCRALQCHRAHRHGTLRELFG